MSEGQVEIEEAVSASGVQEIIKSESGNMNASGIKIPWQQKGQSVTVVGCMKEAHVINGCFTIQQAAAPLPGLVSETLKATTYNNDEELLDRFRAITQAFVEMTKAFCSADSRPLSATYVDPMESKGCIRAVWLPVVPGEKTISGLLFKIFSPLDVFSSAVVTIPRYVE